jgi:hypothetical protein
MRDMAAWLQIWLSNDVTLYSAGAQHANAVTKLYSEAAQHTIAATMQIKNLIESIQRTVSRYFRKEQILGDLPNWRECFCSAEPIMSPCHALGCNHFENTGTTFTAVG